MNITNIIPCTFLAGCCSHLRDGSLKVISKPVSPVSQPSVEQRRMWSNMSKEVRVEPHLCSAEEKRER